MLTPIRWYASNRKSQLTPIEHPDKIKKEKDFRCFRNVNLCPFTRYKAIKKNTPNERSEHDDLTAVHGDHAGDDPVTAKQQQRRHISDRIFIHIAFPHFFLFSLKIHTKIAYHRIKHEKNEIISYIT